MNILNFHLAGETLFGNDVYGIMIRCRRRTCCCIIHCSGYHVVTNADKISTNGGRVKDQRLRSWHLYIRRQVARS